MKVKLNKTYFILFTGRTSLGELRRYLYAVANCSALHADVLLVAPSRQKENEQANALFPSWKMKIQSKLGILNIINYLDDQRNPP